MYQWVLKQCGQKLFYLKLAFDLILEKFKVPANFFKVAVVYPWVCAKPDLDSTSYKNVINQLTILPGIFAQPCYVQFPHENHLCSTLVFILTHYWLIK